MRMVSKSETRLLHTSRRTFGHYVCLMCKSLIHGGSSVESGFEARTPQSEAETLPLGYLGCTQMMRMVSKSETTLLITSRRTLITYGFYVHQDVLVRSL
ncbi:hypothetical protein AVEN_227466-1 [Araneus ventricosus]|uniref:Uncharacterized protein n=1 Tax=Araneus ventricosus TaxID=182803 RepID=A0A4Y2C3F8_ARAVE|nr:hypothetical protein AVEN_227466-1 [Araneus ventricosus]